MTFVFIRKFGHRDAYPKNITVYICADRRREWSNTSLKELQGFLTMARSQGETHGTNYPSEHPEGINHITPWFHTSGLKN